MATRNVVLTNHHEQLITELLGSGRYQNASEILRDGLRLIEERDAREAAKLSALRSAAQRGIDDINSGAFKTFASFDDLDVYLRSITDPLLVVSAEE